MLSEQYDFRIKKTLNPSTKPPLILFAVNTIFGRKCVKPTVKTSERQTLTTGICKNLIWYISDIMNINLVVHIQTFVGEAIEKDVYMVAVYRGEKIAEDRDRIGSQMHLLCRKIRSQAGFVSVKRRNCSKDLTVQ